MPKSTATNKTKGGRNFHIVTQIDHPVTGEKILTKEEAIEILNDRDLVKQAAIVVHDKDVYTAEDEKQNPSHKAGSLKKPHLHIVFRTDKYIKIDEVASWFGIPSNFVDLPPLKGKNGFTACLIYMVHENEGSIEAGKYHYSDDEVYTKNLKFRNHIKTHKSSLESGSKGKDSAKIKEIREGIFLNGDTLFSVKNKEPIIYMNNFTGFRNLRNEYLVMNAAMPDYKINFYICGSGGVGKGLCSKALARALIDPEGKLQDEEIFFCVGAGNVTFDGYDGQPVIIWDDCRSSSLWNKLGSRENIFNVFDMFPSPIKQNIKYGSVKLINKINIVNSVQDCTEFLDGLAGEYTDKNGNCQKSEDKGQSYRRFPFLIDLHKDNFDFKINKGVIMHTKEYQEFNEISGIKGNFQQIVNNCRNDSKLICKYNNILLHKVVEEYNKLVESIVDNEKSSEHLLDEIFENYGFCEAEIISETKLSEETAEVKASEENKVENNYVEEKELVLWDFDPIEDELPF